MEVIIFQTEHNDVKIYLQHNLIFYFVIIWDIFLTVEPKELLQNFTITEKYHTIDYIGVLRF